jgi:hypothetical protein
MSDLAVSDNGEQKTASEFHDNFILFRIDMKNSYVPFA